MFASDDQLAKIQKLIEQAEHFRRHGEDGSADAALARADAMMVKYAIDRAFIEANKPRLEREQPTSVDIDFPGGAWTAEFGEMLRAVADSCRIRVAIRTGKAFFVGFASDIEYARMLWNGIYFAFVAKLDPSWDSARTADENIKILKEAGWKWDRIGEQANAHGFACKPNDGRLKAAYRRQCRLEGVEPQPHTARHAAYRAAYARSFARTIGYRLLRQRKAAASIVTEHTGSALVLADRFGDVEAKFFEMFPHLKPMSDEDLAAYMRKLKEEELAKEADYAKMTPAQQAAFDRKQEAKSRREQAAYERYMARRQDAAGSAAGSAAASQVDLGGAKVGNSSKKEIG